MFNNYNLLIKRMFRYSIKFAEYKPNFRNFSGSSNKELYDEWNDEIDFEQLSQTRKQYEKELNEQKERLKLKITEQKYFKKTSPNFLSWQEKEQIRYLHETDSEEWSAERLSDSFPASVSMIKKVLKSRWRPESIPRKVAHDKNVKKNWSKLNSIALDPELKEHLVKFSNRERLQVNYESTNYQMQFPQIVSTHGCEFKNIVTPARATTRTIVPQLPSGRKSDHFEQKEIASANKSEESTTPEVYELEHVNVKNRAREDKQTEDYAQNISVSKIKRLKDIDLIRVRDCHYDIDGEFLFRVLGNTTKTSK